VNDTYTVRYLSFGTHAANPTFLSTVTLYYKHVYWSGRSPDTSFACKKFETELHGLVPADLSQMSVRQISNSVSHVCDTFIIKKTQSTETD